MVYQNEKKCKVYFIIFIENTRFMIVPVTVHSVTGNLMPQIVSFSTLKPVAGILSICYTCVKHFISIILGGGFTILCSLHFCILEIFNAYIPYTQRGFPERMTLKLSDAYLQQSEAVDATLDLKVLVLNINPGFNHELMKKCKMLQDYSIFVNKVRTYREALPLAQAVEKTINDCIAEDVLREFLLKNRAEVTKMSIFEYNEEQHMQMERRDAMADGIQIGEHLKCISQIANLVNQNMDYDQISSLLLVSPSYVQDIAALLKQHPELDHKEIYELWEKKKEAASTMRELLLKKRAEVPKMSIFEYNEEQHMQMERRDARADGIQIGEHLKCISVIANLVNQDMDYDQIASLLLVSLSYVQEIAALLKQHPELDHERIYELWEKKKACNP
jgi:hypothetical protein